MKKTTTCLPALILATLCAGSLAAEEPYGLDDVKVISAGTGLKYAYRDANGQLVVQDVPPPGYLEALARQRAQQNAVPDVVEETPVAVPVPGDEPVEWVTPSMWLLAVLFAVASAYIFLAPLLRRWRNESRLERVLRHAGIPVFRNVELTVDGHPPTRIDYLACTPAGILVIGCAHLSGEIRGRHKDDFWMQTVHNEPVQTANPLHKNIRDLRVVEALLDNVPVFGRVVYTGNAELPADLQTRLQKLRDFSRNLDSFEKETPDQRSLGGGWRKLMRYPRSNRVTARPMGSGWKRWLHDHWRTLAGISLLTISVTIIVALRLAI